MLSAKDLYEGYLKFSYNGQQFDCKNVLDIHDASDLEKIDAKSPKKYFSISTCCNPECDGYKAKECFLRTPTDCFCHHTEKLFIPRKNSKLMPEYNNMYKAMQANTFGKYSQFVYDNYNEEISDELFKVLFNIPEFNSGTVSSNGDVEEQIKNRVYWSFFYHGLENFIFGHSLYNHYNEYYKKYEDLINLKPFVKDEDKEYFSWKIDMEKNNTKPFTYCGGTVLFGTELEKENVYKVINDNDLNKYIKVAVQDNIGYWSHFSCMMKDIDKTIEILEQNEFITSFCARWLKENKEEFKAKHIR